MKGKLLSLIFLVTCSFLSHASGDVDHEMKPGESFGNLISSMNEAARWLVENGVVSFIESGQDETRDYLYENFGAILFFQPIINDDVLYTDIRIKNLKGDGLDYDLYSIYEVDVLGCIFEYWVLARSNRYGSDSSYRDMYFFLTKSESKVGYREIIHESESFFSTYEFDGDVISLPINNLKVRYLLRSWDFLKDFPQGEGWEKEVFVNRDGAYEF